MIRVYRVAALGLVFLLAMTPLAAAKGAKKKQHALKGRVEAVAKDGSTLTVKVHSHLKKGTAAPQADVEKTFKVTSATKFEKVLVEGKGKGNRTVKTEAASFADLHKGARVKVFAGQDDTAATVDIMVHPKGKAGAGKAAARIRKTRVAAMS